MTQDNLEDASMMPFGKYGVDSEDPRNMASVPADYLLYLDGNTTKQVQKYINENRDWLEAGH
jgi:uncharacterized protein (DUF3820 family)